MTAKETALARFATVCEACDTMPADGAEVGWRILANHLHEAVLQMIDYAAVLQRAELARRN